MSAEAGTEPEAPKRRGRIPQSAWPHILERHRAGATLSAIAREFDCTPSAISYIVRKAEASGIEPAAAPVAEPAESAAVQRQRAESREHGAAETAQPRQLNGRSPAQQEQPEASPSAAEPAVEAGAARWAIRSQPWSSQPLVEQAPEPRPVVRRSVSAGRAVRNCALPTWDAGRPRRPPAPEPFRLAAPVEADLPQRLRRRLRPPP